jgi:uncharacterized protein YbjQ (UPF0145 family)
MREIQEQILSFGELQEPHEVITIAYAGVRMETSKMYQGEGTFPTDAIQQVIIYLQEQAKEMDGDGVKNIDVKQVVTHDANQKEMIDFIGSGTIIRLI